jgi:uncharacterized membrane protein
MLDVVTSSDPGPDKEEPVFSGRLLTLSDGVIAIALTLLVLQLDTPDVHALAHPDSAADLAHELGKSLPQLFSYALSFYVIAQFWLLHRQVFRRWGEKEEGLAWMNFLFLFAITTMPFTSDLLGRFGNNPLAVDIFAVNLLVASLAIEGLMQLARRRGMLVTDNREREARARAFIVPTVMVLSIAVSWWSTSWAKYCWILIAVLPPALGHWADRRAARDHPES